MSVENAAQTRMVQREVSKRNIDISLMDIHVNHGVVYLRGTVRQMRGYDIDLEREVQLICHILRARPGIREIINELSYR